MSSNQLMPLSALGNIFKVPKTPEASLEANVCDSFKISAGVINSAFSFFKVLFVGRNEVQSRIAIVKKEVRR